MKKFFLSCLVGAAAFSASAVETSVTYTYAGTPSDSWGRAKCEIYNVAIRLDNPILKGKKITGIRAVINPSSGVDAPSLWLSRELTLDEVDGVKVNVPDAFSAPVPLQPTSIDGVDGTFGELSVVLDSPYEITEDGVYAGYTFTIPDTENGQRPPGVLSTPVSLSYSTNPNSLYLFGSKSFTDWQAYNHKLNGAALIYVDVEGDFPATSLDLNSISLTHVAVDNDFYVDATVSNTGLDEISSITYSYTVGGQEYEDEIKLSNPIPSDFVNVSSAEVRFPVKAIDQTGNYTVDFKIVSVNGQPNLSADNTASAQVAVHPFIPVHRPMLEDFTGTTCGWCPRGYIAMELLNEDYGDLVTIATYHNGDPMEVTNRLPVPAVVYPAAALNRGPIEDPFYGFGNSKTTFPMKEEVAADMAEYVPASIDATAEWADTDKTLIDVTAVSTFLEDYSRAGYKIGYLLINNGLSGVGPGWIQTNYYYDYDASGEPELQVLTTWPNKVAGLVFNDVVVDVTGMMGVNGSLPSAISAIVPYESSFSFDIAGNSVIQDKDRLYVAAFIINPDGTILNSIKVKVTEGAAVDAVESAEVADVKYYDLSGRQVSDPSAGIFIKREVHADGSVRTVKTVIK